MAKADTHETVEVVRSVSTSPVPERNANKARTILEDLSQESQEVQDAMEVVRRGSELIKVRSKFFKRSRTFFLDENMILRYRGSRKIKWLRTIFKKRDDLSEIYIASIEDIRDGAKSDTFANVFRGHLPEESRCFVLGIGGKYDTLDLIAQNSQIRASWTTALRYCQKRLQDISTIDPHKAREVALRALFDHADKSKDHKLSVNEIVTLTKELNANVSPQYAKQLCMEAKKKTKSRVAEVEDIRRDKKVEVTLNVEEFITFYLEFTKRKAVSALFNGYDHGKNYLTAADLQKFLTDNHEVNVSMEKCENLIQRYEMCDDLKRQKMFGQNGFNCLFDVEYEVLDLRNVDMCLNVYQDMTQPLCHYYIDSSHNTYIQTNQLTSNSRVDSYVIALKSGCRCVEMDVWDGESEPEIFHGIMGLTMTSKLKFRHVCEVVNMYAFEVSKYPVILSIENHCTVDQQRVMAKIMREIFGDKLLTKHLPPSCTQLPSPEDLKEKIIVKCKKVAQFDDNDDMEDDIQIVAEKNNMTVAQVKEKIEREKKETKRLEAETKVADELSDCIVICSTTSFKSFEHSAQHHTFKDMSSFSESKTLSLYEKQKTQFIAHNLRQLSRCYPAGSRTDSSNYNPVPCWLAGCQLVALNYQTGDEPMHINKGLFEDNGRSGYVLKPEFLLGSPLCKPEGPYPKEWRRILKIKVIAAYQLTKKEGDGNDSIIDPYVKIDIIGVPCDTIRGEKTATVEDNGFNPEWNHDFEYMVQCAPFALVYFQVIDAATRRSSDQLVAQYCLPLKCIKDGYRMIHLKSPTGEEGAGELFVNVNVSRPTA